MSGDLTKRLKRKEYGFHGFEPEGEAAVGGGFEGAAASGAVVPDTDAGGMVGQSGLQVFHGRQETDRDSH